LIEGIELTRKEIISGFEKHKIIRVLPEIGDAFDPLLHQAMFEAPMPDTKAGEIIQIMAVGFKIGERLLRPAQVGVSSNSN
jgi:molecular chaperone GrpE